MKDDSETRDAIGRAAKREREQAEKAGKKAPSQEKAEKIWKDSLNRYEDKHKRGGK